MRIKTFKYFDLSLLGTPLTSFNGLITRTARKDFKSKLTAFSLSGELSIIKSFAVLTIL